VDADPDLAWAGSGRSTSVTLSTSAADSRRRNFRRIRTPSPSGRRLRKVPAGGVVRRRRPVASPGSERV